MNAYCTECEGFTHHIGYKVEDKQGFEHEAIECEECETRTIVK